VDSDRNAAVVIIDVSSPRDDAQRGLDSALCLSEVGQAVSLLLEGANYPDVRRRPRRRARVPRPLEPANDLRREVDDSMLILEVPSKESA
jgi:hypothetical protein